MEIHLFYNPAAAAGRSAMRLGAVLASLRTMGAKVELYRPPSADAARRSMSELAGEAERILVVGGDGMVHQAANALVGSSTVLAIVSAGTGNDAVTSLGLPHDVDEACKAALADPLPIDLIRNGDQVGVTVATAGFSVAVNERADAMRRVKGGIKYTLASLVQLPKLNRYSFELVLDGESREVEANLVAVANTAYFGGGMKVAPDAKVNNGSLDVVLIGPASRAAFAAVLPTVFSGRHVRSKHVSIFRAETVEINGVDTSLRVDGEKFGSLPTSLVVEPAALQVAGAQVI